VRLEEHVDFDEEAVKFVEDGRLQKVSHRFRPIRNISGAKHIILRNYATVDGDETLNLLGLDPIVDVLL